MGENIQITAQGKIELGKLGKTKTGKEIVTSKLECIAGKKIVIGKYFSGRRSKAQYRK